MNNTVELKIQVHIIKKVDKETNEPIETKTAIAKRTFNRNNLEGPYQVMKSNGKPYKTLCVVHHKEHGNMEIRGSYEETKKKLSRVEVRGFMGR